MTDAAPLLQVRDLKTHFTFRAPSTGVLPGPKRILKAVDGVSFDLPKARCSASSARAARASR